MKAEHPTPNQERLLRLLDESDPAPNAGAETEWLARQRRLGALLRAAHPAPRKSPDAEAFYRSLSRRLAEPERRSWTWWPLPWLGHYRLAAAMACAVLLAMVWWQWPGTFRPHTRGGAPGHLAQVNPTVGSPAADVLAEIDEIDADTPATTYQLPDSLTPVVLFTWNTESENDAPSG